MFKIFENPIRIMLFYLKSVYVKEPYLIYKAKNVKDIEIIPKTILGAAWKPQKERMEKGFFFPLFVVLVKDFKTDPVKCSEKSIWYRDGFWY